MSGKRNDLPSVNSPNFNQRLRETIQTYLGRQGDPLERGLTLRDLLESGLAKLPAGFKLATGAAKIPLQPGDFISGGYEADLTPPPTPTGLTASGGISHILIEHDAPLYRAGHGHLRTRVYGAIRAPGAAAPVFSDAIEVAQFSGTVYAHPTNPSTTWHLWIKWETADGVLSADPAGGTNGVVVKSGEDVSALVAAMTGPGNPFKVVPSEITLPDGTVVPPGTYTADAFIQNGQIVNAMIGNLAVDNAKIASVSVDKLTAGSISIGQYIQSTGYVPGQAGWRINGDGSAEFGFANIRGTLLASQIGADAITADKIDARGLVIKDALGNPIIQQGMAIDWSKLGGKSQNLVGLGYTGALDATRNVARGPWSSGLLYQVGDLVLFGGQTWACVQEHVSHPSKQPPSPPDYSNGYWVAFSLSGSPGIDYDVVITSSNGTVFRVGQGRQTTLAARVFRNGEEITESLPTSAFKWTRVSSIPREAPYDDATWNQQYQAGYKQITISVDDVNSRATFNCEIDI